MINLGALKPGNRVMVENEGVWMPGTVTGVNADDGGQIEVETGVQQQWYEIEEVAAIPLSDDQMTLLGFEKEVMESGNIKYKLKIKDFVQEDTCAEYPLVIAAEPCPQKPVERSGHFPKTCIS
jgi:hypothetical protein